MVMLRLYGCHDAVTLLYVCHVAWRYLSAIVFLGAGRVESIMVSAPPLIRWSYNVVPEPGSPEEKLVQVLQTPRKWA